MPGNVNTFTMLSFCWLRMYFSVVSIEWQNETTWDHLLQGVVDQTPLQDDVFDLAVNKLKVISYLQYKLFQSFAK